MSELNHKHILINATFSSGTSLSTLEVEDWFIRLIDAIDMKVLIAPQIVYCNTPGNEGITGIVCIETSHSSIHIWSEKEVPFLRFDLYSCKEFSVDVVLDFIKEFNPIVANYMVIDRNDVMKEYVEVIKNG